MPATVTDALQNWRTFKIGGGGYLTGLDQADDGTLVVRTDTSFAYIWDDALDRWRNLVTKDTMPVSLQELGRTAGVYEICICATNSNHIAILFRDRLLVSSNKGLTFQDTNLPTTKTFDANNGILKFGTSKLVFDPVNPNVIYFASDEEGLWRTLDRGTNWALVPTVLLPMNSTNNGVYADIVSMTKTNPITVTYAGADLFANGQVVRAVDIVGPTNRNAVSFTVANVNTAAKTLQLSGVDGTGDATYGGSGKLFVYQFSLGMACILFDRSSALVSGRQSRLYCASNGRGVYKSEDGGDNFSVVAGGPINGATRGSITAAGTLYLTDTSWNNYWKLAGGSTWTLMKTAGNGTYRALLEDPNNSSRLIDMRAGTIVESLNGGTTWGVMAYHNVTYEGAPGDTLWQSQLGSVPNSFMSIGQIAFDTVIPNKLIVAMGFGFLEVANLTAGFGKVTFQTRNRGIEELVAFRVVQPPNGRTFACNQDVGVVEVLHPEAFDCLVKVKLLSNCMDLSYLQSDPRYMAASAYKQTLPFLSTDGGTNFVDISPHPVNNQIAGGQMAWGSPTNIVWIPGLAGQPVYSLDTGTTWNLITLPGEANDSSTWRRFFNSDWQNKSVLVADPLIANKFYLHLTTDGLLGAMFVSTTGGASWLRVYTGDLFPGMDFWYTKLRITPDRSNHLWLAGGRASGMAQLGGLKRSTTGGASWTTIPDISACTDISLGATAPGATYPTIQIIGFLNGVFGAYLSIDEAATWIRISQPFINNSLAEPVAIEAGKINYRASYISLQGHGHIYSDGAPEGYRALTLKAA
jgi:hypothetical protein